MRDRLPRLLRLLRLLPLGRGLHDRFRHLLHGRVHHRGHRILRRLVRLLRVLIVMVPARQVGSVGQSVRDLALLQVVRELGFG
jgi:hypothetical protein